MSKEVMMLIRYRCKGMGLNCPFVVTGDTLEEVVKQALEHVKENHADDFNEICSPEEIKRMERALAQSTRRIA